MLARLPKSHPQYTNIANKIYQSRSGYAGELAIDRLLNQIELPEGAAILKDLTLEINPDFLVQIDTLILTPSIAFLLEIKNYAGTIHFDEIAGKTTKVSAEGESVKYDCIVHQIDRATEALKQWFAKRNIELPVEPILIMANQRTEILEPPVSVSLKYGKQLPRHIRKYLKAQSAESQHTSKQLQTIASSIQSSRIKWKQKNICERYQIDPSELKRGVLCAECASPMGRSQGRTWKCVPCKTYSSRTELEQAIIDWYLLISPTLTNKQLRNYLNLSSNSAASIILSKTRLNRLGNPPGNYYTWDYKKPLLN